MSTTPQWRTPEERELGPDEFPPGTSEPDALDRRDFLRLAGLSIAALSAAACTRQPPEEIVPYVRQPERLTPGIPRWYATAMELGGNALGLLARSHEGRPTKLEGNPDHPMSLGRTNVHAQAALFDLYDPQRSQVVRRAGAPSTWEDFLAALQEQLPRWRDEQGEGLALLSARFNSPTLDAQLAALRQKYPQMRVFTHDPAVPPAAAQMRCDLETVEMIVSIDCDFLNSSCIPADALAFARRRNSGKPIRLHVFESMPSLTGAMADRRYPLKPSDLENAAAELIGVVTGESVAIQPWIAELAAEFQRCRGKAAILVGPHQPAYLREMLGVASVAEAGIEALVTQIGAGAITDLVVLDANPVYTAPVDLHFAEALAKVPRTIHCGLYRDETAVACQWHIPQTHFLESWSDVVAGDGTESIVQPLIEPMYATVSRHEFFAALLGEAPVRTTYEIVRDAVAARHGKESFEARWQQMLHDGVVKAPAKQTSAAPAASAPAAPRKSGPPAQGLELVIRPDPHIWDGRFATNAWLQELPKPMTKLTWENAVHLSPREAKERGIREGDLLVMHYRDRALRAPAFIVPGHADGCVTIHLGYGRGEPAGLAWGIGFSAYEFQFSDALWSGVGLSLEKTGEKVPLATTQSHQTMDVSNPVRFWPSEDLHEDEPSKDETLYPPVTYGRPAWGMVINLDTCIGCSTCTIACEVENNTPVVGRGQVLKGREMHWIRVDRYFAGELEKPKILHQPVPCMHCEHAPCEVVCPVAATVHDHMGLNLMVYNRCIGTRYCSNNCPYKVRRFNFLDYTDYRTQQYKLLRNPDVTVRSRGVMEKCTYCIQRIMEAQITADKEDRLIREGEVIPACAQACPSDAIVFGDINDPASKVASLRRQPQNYNLLGDLNTRPRTTYLARKAPTA